MILRSGRNLNTTMDPKDASNTSVTSDSEANSIANTSQSEINTGTAVNVTEVNKTIEQINICSDKIPEMHIIPFDPEKNMLWEKWKVHFEQLCSVHNKGELWKLNNIQRYLQGKALTIFINKCLPVSSWPEFINIFDEEFLKIETITLNDFSSLRYYPSNDLTDYFHKKLDLGRKLGLSSSFLIDGLTDGLPLELKQLLILNAPKTPTEWLQSVGKLVNIRPKQVQSQYRPFRPTLENRPQWRQRYPVPFQPQAWNRPQQFRSPQQYGSQYQPNFNPQRPVVPRMQNNPRIHFQERLPPSPCSICNSLGIYNSYHWMQECPFRIQSNPNSNVPLSSNVTPGHVNNEDIDIPKK